MPIPTRFVAFFTANIRKPNTRAAYWRAIRRFFLWEERRELSLVQIEPVLVTAYVEDLQRLVREAAPGAL